MTQSTDITVRSPDEPDRPAWETLWREYLRFYGLERPTSVYDWTWSQITHGRDNMFARVAVVDGRPVGLAHFLYHRSFWEPEPRCYLSDLFTAKEARGQGVAAALIDAVYAHAVGFGADGVYWLTAQDNKSARTLYDKVARKTPFIMYMGSK